MELKKRPGHYIMRICQPFLCHAHESKLYDWFMPLTEVWYSHSFFLDGHKILRFGTRPNAILTSGSAKARSTPYKKIRMQSKIFAMEKNAGCLQQTLAMYFEFSDVNTNEDDTGRS
jgi:hypothetical protein